MDEGMYFIAADIQNEIPEKSWSLKNFAFQRVLQKGYAALVTLAFHVESKKQFVLKIYNAHKLNKRTYQQIRREIKIQSKLCHPNIVKMYAAWSEGFQIIIAFEYCQKGDVFHLLTKTPYKTLPPIMDNIVKPMLDAIDYLHMLGYLHRDIKPENIFIGADNKIKLGDFGLAIDTLEERPQTRVGTVEFMAPEVSRHSKEYRIAEGVSYGFGADIWSLGILVKEIVECCIPFYTENPKFLEFIDKCLVEDPKHRATIKELISHDWMDSKNY
jgi:aurora kinase